MPLEQFIHILNPNSKNRSGVKGFFKKNPHLHSVWVDRTQHPKHLETIVDWAIMENRFALAVWGGDGTLSRIIQHLHEKKFIQKVNLLLIPTGTCNDFARQFQLGSWRRLVKKIQNNGFEVKSIDVGRLKTDSAERLFINNAGFGRTKQALERNRSRPIKDIFDLTEKHVQIEWGTSRIHQFESASVLLGVIFNAPYFNKGMYFDADIKPDDGILNGFLVPVQSKSSLLKKFFLSRMGKSLARSADIRLDAEFIKIDSDKPLYPQVDGEPVSNKGVLSLSFSIMPEAIKFLFA